MKNGSQLNFPFVTIVTTPALKKAGFIIGVRNLQKPCCRRRGGFVPVNLFNRNGKLGMSATGNPKEATDHVPCEVVYPNGVILRIQSELSLETLRSLILLYR
ncbi:hypothetical protein NXW26_22480 [Bacteroides faecis]|nr:hypothetical protein [Bacteroides faecis]UVR64226.1 hypothetical protein NXW26_22480 [Bacteroides faecis]